MYYITLDLEWNQTYAQKSAAVQKELGCRLRGEVIQIGAVKLDRDMRPCGSYSVIVKPKYYKKIHRHVEKLTGISQAKMDLGLPLPEAAESFRRFCGDSFVFLTWGPDDIPTLKDNFRIHGLDTAWLDRTYDLQVIFNQQTDHGSKQRSLEYAMEHFGIPQNLPAHDALNDAYFTALVAGKLDVPAGIRAYDASQGQYLLSAVIGNADAGDDGYVTVGEILDDETVKHPKCPVCGKRLLPVENALHSRGQKYVFLYRCEKDGDMFLTLRVKRNFNETWRASYTFTDASEEEMTAIRQKLSENVIRKKVSRRPRRRRKRIGTGTVAAQPSESNE